MKHALPLIAAALLAASPAFAAAPQPARAISTDFYSGTWYEIARTPNNNQKDCQAATSQFKSGSNGSYELVQTCRKGSPSGPAKTFKAKGQIVSGSRNAKFKMTFFGVVNQEYWLLDAAPDQSWAIMATPGGNYVWLLSRKAVMAPATKAAALARVKALGYDTGKLEQPRQPPA